jgi:hypothetical protein
LIQKTNVVQASAWAAFFRVLFYFFFVLRTNHLPSFANDVDRLIAVDFGYSVTFRYTQPG